MLCASSVLMLHMLENCKNAYVISARSASQQWVSVPAVRVGVLRSRAGHSPGHQLF